MEHYKNREKQKKNKSFGAMLLQKVRGGLKVNISMVIWDKWFLTDSVDFYYINLKVVNYNNVHKWSGL